MVERARSYAENAQAPNTRIAYASALRDFRTFCSAQRLTAYPASPQTVVLYITALAERAKVSTIRQRLAAISVAHRKSGLESPTAHPIVREVLRGITRTKGTATHRKDAVTLDVLRAMLLAVDGEGIAALRDRALLLLGFAAALRRAELAALRVEDLRFDKRGLLIIIRQSKTDQTGAGQEVAVPFVPNTSLCAARALRRYLQAAGISSGPVFQSLTFRRELTGHGIDGRDVANLVRRLAAQGKSRG